MLRARLGHTLKTATANAGEHITRDVLEACDDAGRGRPPSRGVYIELQFLVRFLAADFQAVFS